MKVKAKAGDTVAKLAKRHKVSVADLSQWNDLSATAKLKAGQVLLLQKTVVAGGKSKKTSAKGKPTKKTASAAKTGSKAKAKSQQTVKGKKRPA